jgi:hypothetical protein
MEVYGSREISLEPLVEYIRRVAIFQQDLIASIVSSSERSSEEWL